MNFKKTYHQNDRVSVKSFAGPYVSVLLKKRYIAHDSELKLGVNGWEAQIYKQKDVEKLRKCGVPYKKDEKPIAFIADWQIVNGQ